jgi:hypothetical protein
MCGRQSTHLRTQQQYRGSGAISLPETRRPSALHNAGHLVQLTHANSAQLRFLRCPVGGRGVPRVMSYAMRSDRRCRDRFS